MGRGAVQQRVEADEAEHNGASLLNSVFCGPWRIDERRLTLFVVGSLALTCALSRWSNPTRIAEELTTPFNRTIGYSLSSVACAGLVLWLVRFRGSAATAWLRVPPMRYLGRISYGVYLLHIPARETIYFLGHRIGCDIPRDSISVFVGSVALTLVLATVSWHALERPLLSSQ